VIEPKWAPGAHAQYRRTAWLSATDWSFAGVPQTAGHVFFHHIIINMEIDGDIMDVILNNQIKSGRPRSTSMSKVGEVAGLNRSE
jgi:hypothetical protein